MPAPDASSRPRKVNRLGLTPSDYKGKPSTLCKGCGHDAISSQLIRAFFESDVRPHQVAKLSGIGCSSKTPAYFLNHSHGFNAVHGRMPSVATGAVLANRRLVAVGVSGDGDTASIGIGQFVHLVRRNLPLIYIVENNGVYGLTKGQFSATADENAALRSGEVNRLPNIDLCGMAIELGATYVARSFAGDPKQLVALLRGALAHNGTAVLDILSPCVTFNNHAGSTKSYTWGKDNEEPIHILDFVPAMDQIEVEYEEGTDQEVQLHDGSWVRLRKLERGYDPTDRRAAQELVLEANEKNLFLTGLLYLDTSKRTFLDSLELCDEPLALLSEDQLRPPPEVLDEVVASYR
ncbi:MAG: 2-oxoacid:ferredoxin oxidoreductase subunit beta [Acidobacteria bacterium]|nr:2-oxoacid:ferredoxin oxidoreductase subunit beta [Acidobacteriota bacterium]MXW38359.1 2-oxoacid:ferredoxin oxidoreductase subunit beta [Acidobacteriota bacterium]MXZ61071.1 2-oxoacid:ferredoxin oxidoreductase subunit beta [Acidobacteriota bacterium]MYA45684.1 2-oxoacid:ferredoxin oxidoreductase subunit beta [Acidobacteriota bacterium]MYB32774.1 2-oxoacid:ferredoxin oxidoreductase subunit beta [Acidobacteriota bacterium]